MINVVYWPLYSRPRVCGGMWCNWELLPKYFCNATEINQFHLTFCDISRPCHLISVIQDLNYLCNCITHESPHIRMIYWNLSMVDMNSQHGVNSNILNDAFMVKKLFTKSRISKLIYFLTHWDRDKMTAISQTILSNSFSWMKILEFRLKFHWSLFLKVQLTIFQHWLR